MRKTKKAVLTCAVTGAIHTPSMSEYLPITPDEIAEEAVGAAKAGASVLHLHARDKNDGRPSADMALFNEFLPQIKQQCDAVINITTGHGPGVSLEDRLIPAREAQPELASLNMGSFNAGVFPIPPGIEWKYDWELEFLKGMKHGIAQNSFGFIERILTEVGANGTRFEFECYDVGNLYALAHFADKKLIEPPFFIQCIFGLMGGIGPDPENMTYMINAANKLFGDDYYLSVFAAGRHQMRFVTMGAIMGGSVRVGLEDSLYIGKRELAKSNAEQVTKVRRILDELSFEVATPDETRDLLKLKGVNHVGF